MDGSAIIIESFNEFKASQRLLITDFPVRIHVDTEGRFKILESKVFCSTCDGSGGVRYWYAEDESVSVRCPVCNNGSQKDWDRAAEQWEKRK